MLATLVPSVIERGRSFPTYGRLPVAFQRQKCTNHSCFALFSTFFTTRSKVIVKVIVIVKVKVIVSLDLD